MPHAHELHRATLVDIAKIAGVTKSTVSRALVDSPRISESRRHEIQEIARKLHYVPDSRARNLALGRSGLIAILMTESLNELFSDPTYAYFIAGITERIAQSSYLPILLEAVSKDQRNKVLNRARFHIDGIIDISPFSDPKIISSLSTFPCPVVLLGKFSIPFKASNISMVYSDDEKGGEMIARLLKSHGRKKPIAILGPRDNPASTDRLDGYRTVFKQELPDSRVMYTGWDIDSGFVAMLRITRHITDFDGILCASDRLAIGVMNFLTFHHIQVPSQVSVVGFDDSKLALHSHPKLTTIHQPLTQEGHAAAEMILNMLAGKPATTEILPMRLIKRESC